MSVMFSKQIKMIIKYKIQFRNGIWCIERWNDVSKRILHSRYWDSEKRALSILAERFLQNVLLLWGRPPVLPDQRLDARRPARHLLRGPPHACDSSLQFLSQHISIRFLISFSGSLSSVGHCCRPIFIENASEIIGSTLRKLRRSFAQSATKEGVRFFFQIGRL